MLFMVKVLVYSMKYAGDSLCRAAIEDSGSYPGEQLEMQLELRPELELRPAIIQWRSLRMALMGSDIYAKAFIQSEPFVIQATLNEVVRRDFHTGTDYLLSQLMSGIPGSATIFGLNRDGIPTFADIAKPALFPQAEYGMASNPWAQAYAANGLAMVLTFALGYSVIVGMMSLAFWNTAGSLQGCIAVAAAWVAFYFHRNDLLTQIGIMKHVLYTVLFSLTLAWAAMKLRESVSRQLMTRTTRRVVVAVTGIIGIVALLGWHAVDDSLSAEDRSTFPDTSRASRTFRREQRGLYQEEIKLYRPCSAGRAQCRPKKRGTAVGPLQGAQGPLRGGRGAVLRQKQGHREDPGDTAAFETRHIALFSTQETGSAMRSLLTPGVASHAVTEVRTKRGWLVVDSNAPWVSLDIAGNPIPMSSIKSSADRREPLAWSKPLPHQIYQQPFTFVYCLYSRHGQFYPPVRLHSGRQLQ